MPIASAAEKGFSSSAAYNTHRPSYPSSAVEKFLTVLEINERHGAKVLDLAAGTGKFTEILATRPEKFDIVAVEPHGEMRAELVRKDLNDVKVLDGMAESMPDVADGSVDAVIVAQAFHWFSNMKALREINRVLKDRGVLGCIWNIEDYNAPRDWDVSESWASKLRDVLWSLEDGHPRYRDMVWLKVFDEQSQGNPFSAEPMFGLPIGQDDVEFTNWLGKEELWGRFQTYSQIANLEGERLEEVRKIFWDAVNASDVELDDQGRVSVHGKTVFAWSSKIPGQPLQTS